MSSQTTDQQPAAAPVWASAAQPEPAGLAPAAVPAPAAKSSKVKTVIVGVVAALVIGGGGFAVIRAASGDATASTAPAGGPGGMGGGQGGPGMGNFNNSGLSGALYGDFTASDGNGGYTTKRLQTGTVTDISTTSITAKSADGRATTFVIGSSTSIDNGNDAVSDIKTGDTVTVVGTVSGDTATATTITDTALNQANGGGQQNGGPQNGQQPGAAPTN
ncbi:hypothetical protein [Dactylosporangium sp. NPDC051541]|uniref:hypothetical protein n=1 Tax=Dactylosporangium sp. NPDC051541 TaxID=3363977 RepID=UPI00378DC9AD